MGIKFEMISDSTDPQVKSCTGHWVLSEDRTISQRFENNESCMKMNDFIQECYNQGFRDGKLSVVDFINRATKEILWKKF